MAHLLKSVVFAASLLVTSPAQAIDISTELDQRGIQGTITLLQQLSRDHSPDEQFALGLLQYLAAIETVTQAYWQTGDTDNLGILPLPRLDVPPNPNPVPFDPAMPTTLLSAIVTRMEASRAALAAIPPSADLALEVDLSLVWFDVDANGRHGPGEDARSVIGRPLLGYKRFNSRPETPLPVFRFDTADAAWLMSYAHFSQGLCEIVLAYDPTAAIVRVLETHAAIAPLVDQPGILDWGTLADILAIFDGALNQPPDAALLASAHANFMQTVSESRRFWALVALEADNDREWLPNDTQTSALANTLSPGASARTLALLAEAEAVLQGDALIPYFRNASGLGVNLRRLLLEPRPIDLIGWFQGFSALPYLENGRVISKETRWSLKRISRGIGYLLVFAD